MCSWFAFVAVIIVAAIGTQMDREGHLSLRVARMVPVVFQGSALDTLAMDAIRRKDRYEGEVLSRRLIHRRPIPAESLSLYARALAASGKEVASAAALQSAAGRGWRDRFVQRAVIVSALQQGDNEVAVNRIIGLWRIGERDAWLKEVTQASLMSPAGVRKMRQTFIPRERFVDTNFFIWASSDLPLSTASQLGTAMRSQNGEFDCGKFSQQVDGLAYKGKLKAAIFFWDMFCKPNNSKDKEGISFDVDGDTPGPLNWRYPENASVTTWLEPIEGDRTLQYSSTSPLNRTIAKRYLDLEPGHYLLVRGKLKGHMGLAWQMKCVRRDKPFITGSFTIEKQEFTVARGCLVQELSIQARAGSGRVGPLSILRANSAISR